MSVQTVNAAVLVSYGMDFRVTDALRPQPGRDEVLVRIAASGVNPPDIRTFDGAAVLGNLGAVQMKSCFYLFIAAMPVK